MNFKEVGGKKGVRCEGGLTWRREAEELRQEEREERSVRRDGSWAKEGGGGGSRS